MEDVGVGALTFLFTDIEHSTRLWAEHGDAMADALNAHDHDIATAVRASGGTVFKHTGDGACAVFNTPESALRAAILAQLALTEDSSGHAVTLRARMGVHSGPAHHRSGDYFGPTLNRTARVMEAAHGGQVLVSAASAILTSPSGSTEFELVDLGEHRLRDLDEPQRLYQLVAPGLDRSFPPPRSLDLHRHRLPLMRSAFVGRERQVDEVGELLASHRLVTLTGVGGTGKTRLALEVAARQLDRFPDGVFFVDLASVADPRLVVPTIADSIGLPRGDALAAGTRGPLDERVFETLEPKCALIILDNCEHLLDTAAEVTDALLDRCPRIRVLATSREALDVEGEQSYRVPSLSVGGDDAEAVRLFLLRAAAVRPEFTPDDEAAAAVAEVCVRLDGIPLAIELAAAQVSHLGPQEIADRLDDRFRLLVGGGRRRVQRQQTLQATLDWSHDLLSAEEQALLRRLAVFAGGCSLADCEAICADELLPAHRVLPCLGSLVAKSLVVTDTQGGMTRYRLLETIRLYAQSRLVEATESERFRDGHRDRYLKWAESFPPDVAYVDMAIGRALLSEQDNLRAALDWSVAEDQPALAARLVFALRQLWFNGWDQHANRVLAPLLDDPRLDARHLAMCQMAAAWFEFWRIRFDRMASLAANVLELVDDASDPLAFEALYATWLGALVSLDVDRTRIASSDLRDRARAAGHNRWSAYGELSMGIVSLLLDDDPSGALVHFDAAVDQAGRTDLALPMAHIHAATGLDLLGRSDEALHQAQLAGPLFGATVFAYAAPILEAIIQAHRGDTGESARLLLQANAYRRDIHRLVEVNCLIGAAVLASVLEDHGRAGRLMAAVVSKGESPPLTFNIPYIGPTVRAARAALGPDQARQVRAAGAALTLEQALDGELEWLAGLNVGHQ